MRSCMGESPVVSTSTTAKGVLTISWSESHTGSSAIFFLVTRSCTCVLASLRPSACRLDSESSPATLAKSAAALAVAPFAEDPRGHGRARRGLGRVHGARPTASDARRRAPLALALGLQLFWQRALKGAGRPAVSLVASARLAPRARGLSIAVGDRGTAHFDGWPSALLSASGCMNEVAGGAWPPRSARRGRSCRSRPC